MDFKDNNHQGNKTLINIDHLVKYYPVFGGVFRHEVAQVKAVDDVSFSIKEGETLGLVGESGCGKTTVGHTILRLIPYTSGAVHFGNKDIFALKGRAYPLANQSLKD